jgi:hypothetical protein
LNNKLLSCHLPPATCHLPPATCHLPPAACRLPPAACRLPPAACRLPPAASIQHPAPGHSILFSESGCFWFSNLANLFFILSGKPSTKARAVMFIPYRD